MATMATAGAPDALQGPPKRARTDGPEDAVAGEQEQLLLSLTEKEQQRMMMQHGGQQVDQAVQPPPPPSQPPLQPPPHPPPQPPFQAHQLDQQMHLQPSQQLPQPPSQTMPQMPPQPPLQQTPMQPTWQQGHPPPHQAPLQPSWQQGQPSWQPHWQTTHPPLQPPAQAPPPHPVQPPLQPPLQPPMQPPLQPPVQPPMQPPLQPPSQPLAQPPLQSPWQPSMQAPSQIPPHTIQPPSSMQVQPPLQEWEEIPIEDLAFAYVESTAPQKGFSIAATQAEEPVTIYIHHTVADPDCLSEGQPVACKVHLNSKSQPQASAPLWKLVGEVEEGADVVWGDFTGVIEGVTPNSGAIVTCKAVRQAYGRDASISADIIEQCGLVSHDWIRFSAEVNEHGIPSVVSPFWRSCGLGFATKGPSVVLPPMMEAPTTKRPPMELPPNLQNRQTGVVVPPSVQAGTGPQVIPPNVSPSFGPPTVQPSTVPPPPPAPPKTGTVVLPPAGMGTATPGLGTEWVQPAESHAVETAETTQGNGNETGELVVGTVKQTFPQPHPGFTLVAIDPDDESKTAYVHCTVADPTILLPNQPVAFKIRYTGKGQPQATKPLWRLVGEVAEGATVMWGEYHGRIKPLRPEGTAFVECEELKRDSGRDGFCTQQVINDCCLQPGDVIRFTISRPEQEGKSPLVMAPVWKECKGEGEGQQMMWAKGKGKKGKYDWPPDPWSDYAWSGGKGGEYGWSDGKGWGDGKGKVGW